MAGCGCKNKSESNQTQVQQANVQPVVQKQQQTESIKQAIKKTVEKYYNVEKKDGTQPS